MESDIPILNDESVCSPPRAKGAQSSQLLNLPATCFLVAEAAASKPTQAVK